jgi:hypothetical protein
MFNIRFTARAIFAFVVLVVFVIFPFSSLRTQHQAMDFRENNLGFYRFSPNPPPLTPNDDSA